mmetsp:Transcript_13226/g.33034  ORF Transcript_13226/g.33034 Transcript_13226/m.33034 type:complete len:203 (+) Transcript_13226:276-884(+)
MEHARAIPPPRSTCVSPPQLLERRPLLCTPSVRSASVALRANGLSVVVVSPRAAPSASHLPFSLLSPGRPGGPFALRSRLLTALDPSVALTASGTPTLPCTPSVRSASAAVRASGLRVVLSCAMAHPLSLMSRLLPLPSDGPSAPCSYSLRSTCLSPPQPLERRPLLCTPSVCSASVAVRASCPSIVLPRWGGVSFQVSLSL